MLVAFGSAQAQTNLQVIDRQEGNIEQEQRTFSAEEKALLEKLLKSMGVEESIDEVLETKDIKIILEDKTQQQEVEIRTINEDFNFEMGTAPKAFLGIYYNVGQEQPITVTKIVEESAAQKMGLQEGDVIKSINGTEVNAKTLVSALGDLEPGDAVRLEIERNGKTEELKGELGERKQTHYVKRMEFPKDIKITEDIELPKPTTKPMLGVMLGSDEKGVVINGLIDNSPAVDMELIEGDVIKKINGNRIESIEDVQNAVRDVAVGDDLKVIVERDGKKVKANGTMKEVTYLPKAVTRKRVMMKCGDLKRHMEEIEKEHQEIRIINKELHGISPGQFQFDHHMFMTGSSKVFIISNEETGEAEERIIIHENEAGTGAANDGLQFYPNPNNGQFNLEFMTEEGGQADVKVFDANNKLIFEKSYAGDGTMVKETIDISEQPKGIYMIKLEQSGRVEVRKVIVE